MFAVPSDPGVFSDFEYEAIAISYNNSDLVKELQKSFQQGESGITTFRMDNVNYYLIYEAVDFENWTVIGIVPTDVVNASMNTLQSMTLILVAGITLSLGIILFVYIIRQNRQKLKKKDIELLYREELFSTLSSNVDDVFLMLDGDTFQANYISPNIEKLLGVPEKEARSDIRKLEHLVNDQSTASVIDQLPDILPGQLDEWDREYVHQSTGETRWFHVTAMCRNIGRNAKIYRRYYDRRNQL